MFIFIIYILYIIENHQYVNYEIYKFNSIELKISSTASSYSFNTLIFLIFRQTTCGSSKLFIRYDHNSFLRPKTIGLPPAWRSLSS